MIRLLSLLALLFAAGPAGAQDTIQTTRPVTSEAPQGEPPAPVSLPGPRRLEGLPTQRLTLPARFANDPAAVTIRVAPTIPASEIASGCPGHVTREPSVVMSYEASDLPLFIQATSPAPIVLLVENADGSFVCTPSRRGSRQEQHSLSPAVSGTYRIWIGSPVENRFVTGALAISELGFGGPAVGMPLQAATELSASGAVDPQASAIFGDVTPLSASAAANTRTATLNVNNGQSSGWQTRQGVPRAVGTSVTMGGPIGASIEVPGGQTCAGYISRSPTVSFTHDGFGPVDIYTRGGGDTVLFVQTPDGRWYCNDDTALSLSAALRLSTIPPGRYAVYVGAYNSSDAQGYQQTEIVIEADPATLFPGVK